MSLSAEGVLRLIYENNCKICEDCALDRIISDAFRNSDIFDNEWKREYCDRYDDYHFSNPHFILVKKELMNIMYPSEKKDAVDSEKKDEVTTEKKDEVTTEKKDEVTTEKKDEVAKLGTNPIDLKLGKGVIKTICHLSNEYKSRYYHSKNTCKTCLVETLICEACHPSLSDTVTMCRSCNDDFVPIIHDMYVIKIIIKYFINPFRNLSDILRRYIFYIQKCKKCINHKLAYEYFNIPISSNNEMYNCECGSVIPETIIDVSLGSYFDQFVMFTVTTYDD